MPEFNLPTRAAWAEGLPLTLPFPLDSLLREEIPTGDDRQRMLDAVELLRLSAAFTNKVPTSGRLPVSYQTVPGPLRHILANIIGRLQRTRQSSWARFPGWPLDLSADVAADLVSAPTITFARTPVMLTHDIDSPEGLRNLRDMFLPLEEAIGARSANYIVPCAWPVDPALLAETKSRGHEIGIHGYDHANRTAFLPVQERRERLAAGIAFARTHGCTGYRSPSLLRTEVLIEDLKSLYRYDSSIPTSGGAFPVPNNGCASARPWRFGPMWEIPLSMPRDGSMRFLGYSPAEIGQMWRNAALRISASGGAVNLLTHCEAKFSGNPAMLTTYESFLQWIAADSRFDIMLPVTLVNRLDQDYPITVAAQV